VPIEPLLGVSQDRDAWRRYALQNQQAGASQTYVGLVDNELIGYYTLAFGAVEHEEVPARVGTGLARCPIPLMVLARLAVSSERQRRGVGAARLKDIKTDLGITRSPRVDPHSGGTPVFVGTHRTLRSIYDVVTMTT
jgi:GNAT superfamily N-acetyltransferase